MTKISSRPALWLAIVAATFMTAGCGAPAASDATGDEAPATDNGAAERTTEQCPVIDGYEYFSDSSITKYPEAGQVFGDGTAITFEAPAEYYALYTLYYVDESGEVLHQSGGGFSQEAPDGVFTTDLLVFGEEANNRPGILELETVYQDGMVLDTPDPQYQAGVSTVTLGRYCLTLKAS